MNNKTKHNDINILEQSSQVEIFNEVLRKVQYYGQKTWVQFPKPSIPEESIIDNQPCKDLTRIKILPLFIYDSSGIDY